MSHSLIVLPDDTALPIVAAIDAAQKSLRVKMFLFSDPTLLAALVRARKRGVAVRVMLNPARRSGEEENVVTRKALADAGVEVADSNPAFQLTHEKSMIVDDHTAFVKSLNWETRNLTETRDYAVVTRAASEVAEIAEGFEADWHRKPFDPGHTSHLVWCSVNGRERIAHFIDDAKDIALAAERAVPGHGDHRAAGARRAPRREGPRARARAAHAQEGQADRGRGRIAHPAGRRCTRCTSRRACACTRRCCSPTTPARSSARSISRRAASTSDASSRSRPTTRAVVKRLHQVVHKDWKSSKKLDLSDEGLIADLEKRHKEGAEQLVLDGKHRDD